MERLSFGDKAAIVANSNGIDINNKKIVLKLIEVLSKMGFQVELSSVIYKKYSIFNGSRKDRADELMKFFKDKNIKVIFDISGGDVANEILEYIDFEVIRENPKMFFGYSDLTVILNSLYAKTGMQTFLYQIRNLCGEYGELQRKRFENTFINGKDKSLLDFKYRWIKGSRMEGEIVGGNIRCLLKLSGTEYMPDFTDKIIFLESMSGDVGKMITYLMQYKQMGVFNKVKGVILGTFSEMEAKGYDPDIIHIAASVINNPNLPIIKTDEIGHGSNSKCIIIGKKLKILEDQYYDVCNINTKDI